MLVAEILNDEPKEAVAVLHTLPTFFAILEERRKKGLKMNDSALEETRQWTLRSEHTVCTLLDALERFDVGCFNDTCLHVLSARLNRSIWNCNLRKFENVRLVCLRRARVVLH